MRGKHQNKNRKTKIKKSPHVPVLLNEVLQVLAPKLGESYLDLTAGAGGHAELVLKVTKNHKEALLVDRDAQAVALLKKSFPDIDIRRSDFLATSQKLVSQGRQFDLILADLGVSSLHLDQPQRGFSLRLSGPLDMRMDSDQSLSAEEIVNRWPEKRLVQILKDYGQEPKARAIARRIVQRRPLKTTDQLAAIAASVWRLPSRMHPATRTFQALRIAVNDELQQLAQTLPNLLVLLKPGGRLAIISFHSLEDREVKRFLEDNSGNTYDAQLKLLTKKPLTASQSEIVLNPRARSAKLRAAAKTKIERIK